MVGFEELMGVIKRDNNFEKLVVSAEEHDTLGDVGFDSLDVMVVAHMVNMEYKIVVELTNINSFRDILNQVNSFKE